jgi:hypothetical protein
MYTKVLRFEELSNEDLSQLEEIDIEGLMSYLNDPFTFTIALVYDEKDKIIAAGMSRVIEEYKLITNPLASSRVKSIAIRDLMTISTGLAKCNEIIVFVTRGEEHYENFLKKHFNFRKRDGVAMMREA